MAKHTLMGGKLHVYKRENSDYWQCSTYLAGKNRRVSTKEESLSKAKDFAEDWFLELHGKHKRGEVKNEKTFQKAVDQFLREYDFITEGQRNQKYVDNQRMRLEVHLLPFFGKMGLSEITSGQVQEYRIHRREKAIEKLGKPPARSTMHQEIVALRQVLKTALRHGWLQHLPDLSEPYKGSSKVSHRAWFSPEEYKQLYTATRNRAKNPIRERYQWEYEQLHDFVLFMANTGLRPDEAIRLEHRDVEIIHDEGTDEIILEISVRGKRGVGFCKSTTGAVKPYQRLKDREKPEYIDKNKGKPSPTDKVFPKTHRQLLNNILEEEGLKFDRDEQPRTAYSLRHTYICFRLMEGADIYQIAKNCRTSVEMIEKYYASHIKNSLDASAINVRKAKSKPVNLRA
ncbi:MAG: tyrosine-type recombinase/integrase [Alphaproteobacteria bacterium]|nr:tyrosine-type recombinase/integrase [Alphaproteobacteria bacterium]